MKSVGSRDTLKIANELDIKIYYQDFKDLLGMYTCRWKHRIIVLNNKLDYHWCQMVVGHEIGHDAYHRTLASTGLKEFTLFNMKNDTEYVANAFAAHLLLDNDEVLGLAMDDYDIVQIAGILNSDINLMIIKMLEMNKMGYNFNVSCRPESDFFRKIKV